MKNNRIGYSQVVPDSGFWTSIDQMITYFTQMPVLDKREILVHLENMKKRGYSLKSSTNGELVEDFNVGARIPEEVMKCLVGIEEGDSVEFIMPPFCSGDYIFEVKIVKGKFVCIDAPPEIFKGCREFKLVKKVEIDRKKYVASLPSVHDYFEEEGHILKKKQRWEEGENDDNKDDGLVKDENGQPKGYTAKEIRASGVFGIIHGDMGGLDNYPVIDSKTYLTKEKFEQMFQASVERDLNRCK